MNACHVISEPRRGLRHALGREPRRAAASATISGEVVVAGAAAGQRRFQPLHPRGLERSPATCGWLIQLPGAAAGSVADNALL